MGKQGLTPIKIGIKPRSELWAPKGKGPTGRNLCFCGCGREVAKGRHSTFEQACYDRWALINDPPTIRRAVFARDHGICAKCGTDTEAIKRAYRATLLASQNTQDYRSDYLLESLNRRHDGSGGVKVERPAGFPRLSSAWWESHHKVAVAEGGGGCGPEGYATLCVPCHKAETAALAKRLAERRRAEKLVSR